MFMRSSNFLVHTTDSTPCRMCSPTLRSLSNVFGVDIGFCRNADIVIVKALMSTLTTAVESYIGLNICFSALILDDAKSYEIKVAQEALQALSL
jgi:hypothetical protein